MEVGSILTCVYAVALIKGTGEYEIKAGIFSITLSPLIFGVACPEVVGDLGGSIAHNFTDRLILWSKSCFRDPLNVRRRDGTDGIQLIK
jgi:hypothetical protein